VPGMAGGQPRAGTPGSAALVIQECQTIPRAVGIQADGSMAVAGNG
jgi:hypothetical protein